MADEEPDAPPRRRSIQSIEIGMRILKALAVTDAGSPLGALSQAVGMAAPQVHRYLQSLIAAGMARQDTTSGRYELGPEALRIGLVALARTDLFRIVDRDVGAFVERSGQAIQISALGSSGPIIVRIYNGRPALLTTLHVGSVLPLLTSATGQVFLAFVPPSETAGLIAAERPREQAADMPVEAIAQAVRSQGSAMQSSTVIPGLAATAFPIFDLQGRAQLVATALTSEADTEGRAASVAELGTLCRHISAEAGWIGGEPATPG